MKKILALCLTLVLLANCATTAFAAEDTCAGSGETEITAHIYSTYTITIPATIDLEAGTRGEVTITDANLESGYKVDVFATNFNNNGGITLTHRDNSMYEITCMLTNIEQNMCATAEVPLVSFYDTEVPTWGDTATKYFDIQVQNYGLAGHYSGTMTYSFSCNPYEQQQG